MPGNVNGRKNKDGSVTYHIPVRLMSRDQYEAIMSTPLAERGRVLLDLVRQGVRKPVKQEKQNVIPRWHYFVTGDGKYIKHFGPIPPGANWVKISSEEFVAHGGVLPPKPKRNRKKAKAE